MGTVAKNQVEAIGGVVVVGTGFVGLPLALMLAEQGTRIVGVDIDENLVEAVNDLTLDLHEEQLQESFESDRVGKLPPKGNGIRLLQSSVGDSLDPTHTQYE